MYWGVPHNVMGAWVGLLLIWYICILTFLPHLDYIVAGVGLELGLYYL